MKIYNIFKKTKVYGMDSLWCEDYDWVELLPKNLRAITDPTYIKQLDEWDNSNDGKIPDDIEKLYYFEHNEYVKSFLSEEKANGYIKDKNLVGAFIEGDEIE